MSRVTLADAAKELYLAMHHIINQLEQGKMPEQVDLDNAQTALATADKIKALRCLVYADANDDRESNTESDELPTENIFEAAGVPVPLITAVEAEEKKWSLNL